MLNTNMYDIVMEGIYQTNDYFDFSKLLLLTPTTVPGGNYFIKFRINESPLYIQPPKCKTKQAITKSGKRIFCDLMFTNENEQFIRWMENLENYCKKIIFENRSKWFETELDEDDIENSFTSPLKIFKSGKFYISRTHVPVIMGNCSLKIYNESEEEVNIETIQENTNVMTILEIQGIKCSPRNFQIEIEIKQMMVLQPQNIFEKCIFKKKEVPENIIEKIEDEINDNKIINSDTSYNKEDDNNYHDIHVEKETSIETYEENPIKTPDETFVETPDETFVETPDETFVETNMDNQNTIEISNEKQEDILENNSNILESQITEFDFDLDKISENDTIQIKRRNDIYYEMYKEAKRKAKIARDLALSSYLEAKRIKNTYLLNNIHDSDSDLEEESFQNIK
jgi:hypothetical protein